MEKLEKMKPYYEAYAKQLSINYIDESWKFI
jgi:hypothetical protein